MGGIMTLHGSISVMWRVVTPFLWHDAVAPNNSNVTIKMMIPKLHDKKLEFKTKDNFVSLKAMVSAPDKNISVIGSSFGLIFHRSEFWGGVKTEIVPNQVLLNLFLWQT